MNTMEINHLTNDRTLQGGITENFTDFEMKAWRGVRSYFRILYFEHRKFRSLFINNLKLVKLNNNIATIVQGGSMFAEQILGFSRLIAM